MACPFRTIIDNTLMALQTTIIPHTQKPYVSRVYPSTDELDKVIQSAVMAQKAWNAVSLSQRITIGRKFMVRALVLLPATVSDNAQG